MSSEVRRILVIGSESYALALAAVAARAGHLVKLAPDQALPSLDRLAARAGVDVAGLGEPGFAPLTVVDPPSLGSAAADADLIVISTTLSAHRQLCAQLASVRPTAGVLLAPGGVGGAFAVAESLPTACFVAELPGFPYLADVDHCGRLTIRAVKRGLPLGVLPPDGHAQASRLIGDLLPETPAFLSVMETSLGNTNVLIHPPLVLTNWSRIEQRQPFRFYREGLSAAGVRMIEAIDNERRVVAGAFGLQTPMLLELMLDFYADQGMHGANIGEALGSFPPFANTPGPAALDHRYLTDDVPFGLVPIAALGGLAGVATPAIDALVEVLSRLSGQDLRAEGRSLAEMGMAGLSSVDAPAFGANPLISTLERRKSSHGARHRQ